MNEPKLEDYSEQDRYEGHLSYLMDYEDWAKRSLSAIKAEIITYNRREHNQRESAWITIELIEKVLDGSYFKENSEE